jgi:hypothetical protein
LSRHGSSVDVGAARLAQLFDQAGEQASEILFARIAANAPDLAAVLTRYEHRSRAFYCNEIQVGRDRPMNIDPARGRAKAVTQPQHAGS